MALGQGVGALAAQAEKAEQAFEVVEGQVIKVDLYDSRVMLQRSVGSLHEFKASSETLKGLKVGDRIEAKRQPKSSAGK
jgi:hypothetical protein